MKTNSKLLTATIGLGMLLAAPLAMANDQDKKDMHAGHDKTHADRHDSNEPVTDTWITTKVKGDLAVSSNVPATDISVTTVNGVVSLSGNVANKAEHDKAVATAKNIKGVTRVDAAQLKVAATPMK
ncbi:BON domain-containing protein [Stenotrophomonas sp. 169]|uniref:BON domain-containing protein n=1 Tax=unclassified Stenotrophomonas TaxID=196198 RepID=UPI0016627DC2|nr:MULTISPECIES: BON domain-containing protein [unclassified Stenotrophomonas]MBD8636102.1 BON domain-containing protein [Stenotrophomonas sp. CFBP 13725]MBD8695573.1 BON domain-containing protein [Stenotrophomonas sp. CFBP 13718]QNR97983.1 BON domain-containing protein [Stenotrophomonas sp. 169]